MLGFLYRWIVGRFSSCEHRWDIIREYAIDRVTEPKGLAGDIYVLQCKRCGTLKNHRVMYP